MPSPALPTFSAQMDQLGDLLRHAVEGFCGRELKEIDPSARMFGAGVVLGFSWCWNGWDELSDLIWGFLCSLERSAYPQAQRPPIHAH